MLPLTQNPDSKSQITPLPPLCTQNKIDKMNLWRCQRLASYRIQPDNVKPLIQGLLLRFLFSHATVGGLTISLNRAVPQTKSAKPATCSHLNDSQPRPSETSQMKSVRQVSIVLRAVALICRVTERPKKLKPL